MSGNSGEQGEDHRPGFKRNYYTSGYKPNRGRGSARKTNQSNSYRPRGRGRTQDYYQRNQNQRSNQSDFSETSEKQVSSSTLRLVSIFSHIKKLLLMQ